MILFILGLLRDIIDSYHSSLTAMMEGRSVFLNSLVSANHSEPLLRQKDHFFAFRHHQKTVKRAVDNGFGINTLASMAEKMLGSLTMIIYAIYLVIAFIGIFFGTGIVNYHT